ncbi:phytoene/squalene synthase family protein [soil metagenome]
MDLTSPGADLALVAPASIARTTIAHHSKSFALASSLLGSRVRDQTAIVYTWCRRTDDAIDEGQGDHADTLRRLASELDAIYAGTSNDPVLAAFGDVVRERNIPRLYPDELIAGMEMDVADTRYATVDDLLLYCYRVAGVVGLMMTHVFGIARDEALQNAVHLGLAMQLTNICRDVAEDWERGRLYLPDELLAKHGAGELRASLGSALPSSALPAIARVVEELLATADRYYRSGDRGVPALPWRAALAVRAARSIYSAIGSRVAMQNYDVTAGRAFVSKGGKIGRALAALGSITLSAPMRLARAVAGRTARVPATTLQFSEVTRV